jgi:hypothetical protein
MNPHGFIGSVLIHGEVPHLHLHGGPGSGLRTGRPESCRADPHPAPGEAEQQEQQHQSQHGRLRLPVKPAPTRMSCWKEVGRRALPTLTHRGREGEPVRTLYSLPPSLWAGDVPSAQRVAGEHRCLFSFTK